jgi:hypothetical protein
LLALQQFDGFGRQLRIPGSEIQAEGTHQYDIRFRAHCLEEIASAGLFADHEIQPHIPVLEILGGGSRQYSIPVSSQ